MALINLKIAGDAKEANQTINELEKRLKSLNQLKIHIGISEKELTELRKLTAEQAKLVNANAKLVNANARLKESEDKLAISIEKTKQARANARKEQAKNNAEGLKAEARIRAEVEATNRAVEATKRQADMNKRAAEATVQSENKRAAAVAKMGTEIAKAAQEETKLTREREKAARAAEEHGKATENESKAISNLGSNLKGSFLKMSNTLGSTIRNRISSAITSAITSATRDAINTMREVDTQLTNIQKVSNISNEERQRIGASAFSTASKYGVSADDYLSSVYTFKKAGINESAEAMAELATKTMLVGDTTATVASKFLIAANAAWKYNGDITALSKVVDEADWINNNYATDLAKLSAGMPVVASTAANMGMTLEETMAVLGTITAVTQESGTKAATAWRALSMNLAKEIGTFLTEDGDEIEVTAESIKSVTDALVKYAPAVVEAAKASGEMIDPIKAIEGLSKAYKDGLLTDVELTNILMSVGGKLRTNQLTALVKNFDMYEKMLGELEHAAGTADKEIDTMMGSWERKAQVLKNTWTEFISHLVSSEMFKNLISGVTGFVEGLDMLSGSLMAVAAAGVAALAAFGPWGGLIAAAVTGIALLVGHIRNANDEYELATEALDRMNDAVKEQNQLLEDTEFKSQATATVTQEYIDKLKELEKGGLRTKDAQAQYHDTLVRITELMPELKQYIDLENDSILGGVDALEKRAEAWVSEANAAAYASAVKAKATALTNAEIAKQEALLKQERAKTDAKGYREQIEAWQKEIDAIAEKYSSNPYGWDPMYWSESDQTQREKLIEKQSEYEILAKAAEESYESQKKAAEEYDEAIKKAKQDLEDTQEVYKKWQLENQQASGNASAFGFDSSKPFFEQGQQWQTPYEEIKSPLEKWASEQAGIKKTTEKTAAETKKVYDHTALAAQAAQMYKENIEDAAEAEEEIAGGFNGAHGGAQNRAARPDRGEKPNGQNDLGNLADETEQNAGRITSAVGELPPAYENAQKQITQAQGEMVADAESFVEDTASAIEREAATAADAAASAGTTIGLSFAKAIDQSDAVITGIANMVGAAKQFMASLGGSFSIHPSGANYYLERGTGKQIFYGNAAGTTNAPGGPTLVNELGPELINDNGRVYIANGGKPAVVNLSKGSIVLTAEQTKGALDGANRVPKYGAAFGVINDNGRSLNIAGTTQDLGKPAIKPLTPKELLGSVMVTGTMTNAEFKEAVKEAINNPQPTGGGGRGGGRGGGSSSTPGKTAAQLAKEASEKRKKELEAAQKKLDDSLSNLDKQIKLALNKGDEKKAAQLYEKQQQLIADMVKKYQKAGYKDTSNEILDLLNKNYDIAGKQESLYKDKFDDLIDSLDANTDAEKKANTLAEKAQAVSDAQEALANAQKQRTVRIYNAATGQWEWIADEKQVKSAEENLKKAEQSYADEVKSQALEELKSMRDTISNLNDIVLGPALSTVATMGSDTSEFQAFAQALHAVYGVGSYLVGTQGSSKVLPTNDSHDTVYSFGDLVLTEEQASTMTLKQLAQQLQVLKLTS